MKPQEQKASPTAVLKRVLGYMLHDYKFPFILVVACILISAIAKLFAPIVWFLTASTNAVLRLLGIDPNAEEETVSEEEIRMMVEPSAAYYAALRASQEEIRTIDDLRAKIEEQVAHGQNPLKTEQDFHNAIALASHNQFMTKLMPIISKAIYTDITYFEESITYSLQDHREIVRFIQAGNAKAARSSMELHIFHAYQISNLRVD